MQRIEAKINELQQVLASLQPIAAAAKNSRLIAEEAFKEKLVAEKVATSQVNEKQAELNFWTQVLNKLTDLDDK